MNDRVVWLNTFGALGLMVVGAAIVAVIFLTRSQPDPGRAADPAVMVEVIEANAEVKAPRIVGQGTVVPAREIEVQSEVGGRVLERHQGLVDGGVVAEGETLFRIDPRDYEIALEESRTRVEQARADRELEEGHQRVAKKEWQRFSVEGEEEPPPLALREPQLRQAELAIERAEQDLSRAELDLERTEVEAPFTALVTEAKVDPGELVSSQTAMARLVALDAFWVMVSVPVDAIGSLAIPGRDGDEGSRAVIHQQTGERTVTLEGRIIRLLGDLNPNSRMARLIVRVEDPFSMVEHAGEAPADTPKLRDVPLLLGSYVTVELEGHQERSVIEVPRMAVRDGDQVYVANADGELEMRSVKFAWKEDDSAAVISGLESGEQVIVSPLAAPIEGMKVRTQEKGRTQEKERAQKSEEPAQHQKNEEPAQQEESP